MPVGSYNFGDGRYTVYEVSEEDIERSSTLEEDDLGRYYIVVQGCFQFVDFDPEEEDEFYDESLHPFLGYEVEECFDPIRDSDVWDCFYE